MNDGNKPGVPEQTVTVSHLDTQQVDNTLTERRRAPAAAGGLPIRDRERYEFLEEHARGGLGRVWRARDRELGRVVALKEVLPPDEVARARFVREALVTARLEHPAIVPVHEAGRWTGGEPFYVMKLVSGRTLAEVVKDKTRLADRLSLLPSVIAVADAVAYAHAQGVMHRDLKPANVIVGAYGETVVIDWGLAKDMRAADPHAGEMGATPDPTATVAGSVVGTPSFMAPEQARGDRVDERADVYALGALLYFVLTGRPPHSGASTGEILRRVRSERPRRIAALEPGVSADLAAIADKAMAPAAAERYPTAEELVRDLKRFQTGQIVSAHEYSLAQLVRRWVRRNRGVAVATALFALVAGIGVVAFVVREQGLRLTAEAERDRADQKTLALLEEQGRVELAKGRPIRAAAYLVEAYRRNPSSLAIRFLVSQAVRPMDRLERRLVGHTRDVPYAAYSPDGTRIVTASSDGTARIWASDDGRQIAVLKGDDQFLDAATFSPDGRLVATATDHAVRLYRADTGEHVRSIDDPDAYRIWFMPDGKRLVIGTQSGILRLRDVDTGDTVDEVKHHTDRIQDLAFSPDGKRFAVASYDGVASVWDVATFRPRLSLRDPDAAIRSGVAYSADGTLLLTVDMEVYIRVRRADTGETVYSIRLPDGARDSRASFSPDGRTIVTCSQDGGVRIWHAASGTLLEGFDAPALGKLMNSAIRPDGRQLVTTGVAGDVRVWRLGDRPDWRLLAVAPGERGDLGISAYVRDGAGIVTGGENGEVVEWDAATGARLRGFRAAQPFAVMPNRDGSRVAIGHGNGSAPPELWDAALGQRVAVLEGSKRRVESIAASADGATIATASYDGAVRLYDSHTGARTGEWKIDTQRLMAVGFRPDGREVAATNDNGKLILLDPATGHVVRTIPAHPSSITDVEYSRDGARIVTAGRQDHTAKVWEAATGRLLVTLSGHQNNLIRGTFSPDGTLVATSAMDNTAIVWDARTGEILRTIPGPCYTAVFSPRGTELFTAGHFAYGVIWDLHLDRRTPEDLAAFVAERSPWELVDGRARLR